MRLTHYDCGCVHGVAQDRESAHLDPAPLTCRHHRCGQFGQTDVTGGVLVYDIPAGRYEWLPSVFLSGPKDKLEGWIEGERFRPAEGGLVSGFSFMPLGGRRTLWLPPGAGTLEVAHG